MEKSLRYLVLGQLWSVLWITGQILHPSFPPRLATSPPSQRNLPRHSLALVEDARKIGAGPWLCIIKPAPLYMSSMFCKICPVIITSEQSRFNHGAKPMLDISEAGLDLGCHKVLTGLLPITACSESHSCFNPAWPAQLFFGHDLLSLPLSKYYDGTQDPKSTLHVKRLRASQQCLIVQRLGNQANEFNK